jgi:hypothetical protein
VALGSQLSCSQVTSLLHETAPPAAGIEMKPLLQVQTGDAPTTEQDAFGSH